MSNLRILVSAASLFLVFAAKAQSETPPPKLVVGIVVDQMRNDYLQRFGDHFEEGGFKRLMNDGYYCANHHFSYVPTYTGPGHASVYTGTTPAVHGIAANNWYDPRIERDVYCVEDKSVRTVGIANADGQMSPENLKVSTVTDELMLRYNMRSKVVGLSIKDRGAILPAGHLGQAWWYSKGRMITSSYYADELPEWVNRFNDRKLPDTYMKKQWSLLREPEIYTTGEPDDSPYEMKYAGEEAPLMPKDLPKLAELNGFHNVFKKTPYCNSFLIDFAKAAVREREMGKGEVTDFLAVSFSTPDYLGHAMGTRSVEVHDMYLRLDRDLADFFDFLDSEVGAGEYVVFLTADHGAADVPQYNMDMGMPGGYLDRTQVAAEVAASLEKAFGKNEFISAVKDDRIFLNREAVAASDYTYEEVCSFLAATLRMIPGIYNAYPVEPILSAGAGGEFPFFMLSRGLYPPLAGDIIILQDNGWLSYGPVGTSHGSPWTYDTHVPLLLYGKNISPGRTYRRTEIRDIAPTVSMLLGIGLPSGTTGQPILEVLE